MKDYKLLINQMVSVLPSKVSLTTEIHKQIKNSNGSWIFKPKVESTPDSDRPKLVRKFHNFQISPNSARKLRQKIDFLYHYSKSRTVRTYTGKKLRNFKTCFLTLTLPSEQVHNTGLIITNCLDPFLQICRQRLGMRNYVWRLEFQANGNAHFHILTDTYIDYYFARKHWNRSVNSLGYLDSYKSKMSNLSYMDYSKLYGTDYKGNKVNPDVLFKRYNAGVATNWSKPNSVDVKAIRSNREIALYISKYFSKKEKTSKCNPLDNEENSFAIRLCYWSRSLSRLELETLPRDYYSIDLIGLLDNDENVLRCVYDYCVVYYFDLSNVDNTLRDYLNVFLEVLRVECEYIPAG